MKLANKWTTGTLLAVAAGLVATTAVGTPTPPDPFESLPSSITLTGVVRDFRERTVTGGHTDFELNPSPGFGHFQNIVADELDSDGKPVFRSTGFKTNSNWRDRAGRNIMQPRSYISTRSGDVNGSLATTAGAQVEIRPVVVAEVGNKDRLVLPEEAADEEVRRGHEVSGEVLLGDGQDRQGVAVALFGQQRPDMGGQSAEIKRQQHRLDRADGGGRHRQGTVADGQQRHRLDRPPPHRARGQLL